METLNRPEPNEEDFIILYLRDSDTNVDAIVLKKEQIRLGVALEVLYKHPITTETPDGYKIDRISSDDPNIIAVYNEKTGPKIDKKIANDLSYFASMQPEFTILKKQGGRKRCGARRTRHNRKSKRRVNRKSKRR
jgi:hypothetical protein